ncbi:hypothetical protein L7H23_11280 [Sphingopyxis sp. BSN-002]|uniref:hypothetical protein n=1 Tax=Sphingopyxis sp. BSN-002 TaxID=2911495 RepID=UPI001EDAEA14|nr:hypothetical protein [Sphingopyxis sp. BSN-002]UKK83150.1 hypothetical protein L7H23_11280 [Sphingopyxis sp. BSN-002]
MYDFIDRPVESLNNSGRFLLWAMRGWTRAAAQGACPPAALHRGFAHVNALAALPDFHVALALLNADAREALTLGPTGCSRIAEDEALLLALWRAAALDRAAPVLALIVKADTTRSVAKALGAAAGALAAAGFDLSRLSPSHHNQESPTR